MHEINNTSFNTVINFIALEFHFEKLALEQQNLEALIKVLPGFPYSLSPFQSKLCQALYSENKLILESYIEPSLALSSTLTLEGLEELTRTKAKEIVKGSQSVLDWLYNVLDKLHETTESFIAEIGSLEHKLKPYSKSPAAKGSFVYKSIPRNLSIKGKVTPNSIPTHLDQFLLKSKIVRDSCDSKEFHNLLKEMTDFESTADETTNTKTIDDIFNSLKEYLKTILPDTTTKALEHLEQIEGRVLMYDPVEYISDHRFYAYVPTEAIGAVSTVTSGIIRVDQQIDLNQEIPYLSPKESQNILDTIKHHLHDFDDRDKFKTATVHLRELQTELFKKYTKAKRMRKDTIDAKPYVILMNICAGLVYGMHVKALNKSVSVIIAALRYVSRSVKALEVEHTTKPE